jgi:hypothetical protein
LISTQKSGLHTLFENILTGKVHTPLTIWAGTVGSTGTVIEIYTGTSSVQTVISVRTSGVQTVISVRTSGVQTVISVNPVRIHIHVVGIHPVRIHIHVVGVHPVLVVKSVHCCVVNFIHCCVSVNGYTSSSGKFDRFVDLHVTQTFTDCVNNLTLRHLINIL